MTDDRQRPCRGWGDNRASRSARHGLSINGAGYNHTMPAPTLPTTSQRLNAIKIAHTIVWALFAGCILAIPVASLLGEHRIAAWLAAIVFAEVLVLLLNQWSCPLTSVAARYTEDRRPNFDIYLTQWLARYNKQIFGPLYVAGMLFALVQWLRS